MAITKRALQVDRAEKEYDMARVEGTTSVQEQQPRAVEQEASVVRESGSNESTVAAQPTENQLGVEVREQSAVNYASLTLLSDFNRSRLERNLLAVSNANNGNIAPARTSAVGDQPSLDRAELERRAQHIFERFQDGGALGISSPETAYAEIAEDLNGLNAADAKVLQEIYRQKYSAQRQGRDLLQDVSVEVPLLQDRLRAFRILAPENIRPQLEAQTTFGNQAGIVADPPRGILAAGTPVKYSLNEGAMIRPLNAPPPFVRYLVQTENGVESRVGRSFDAQYDKPGTYQVTFEVFYGNQPPQYYVLRQEVRAPQDLAQQVLNNLPGTAPDPDVFLAAVDQEIINVEQQLGDLRANPAANASQIRQLENALAQLRETKAEVPSKLFDGAVAKPLPLRATLIARENSQPVPLQLYAKPLGNNRWAIVDLTIPTDARVYEGGGGQTPEEGLRNAWNTFVAQNNLPAGQLAARPPATPPGYQKPASFPARFNFGAGEIWQNQSDGSSDFKTWSNRVGVASLVFTGLGILSLFGPGTQVAAPFLFGAAGATGAASGGLNIADRVTHGNFELRSLETALDALGIVGGAAQLGGAISAARNIGSATVRLANGTSITVRQADELGNRLLTITSAVDNAAGVTSGVIVGATYAKRIDEINSDPSLTPAQREQRVRAVLGEAAMFGGLVLVGHTAGNLATRRMSAAGAQTERQVIQNLGNGLSGAEIDDLIARRGGETVRWAGTDLQGTAARALLTQLDDASLKALRTVPAKRAHELLQVLGSDNLNQAAASLGEQRLAAIITQLGTETNATALRVSFLRQQLSGPAQTEFDAARAKFRTGDEFISSLSRDGNPANLRADDVVRRFEGVAASKASRTTTQAAATAKEQQVLDSLRNDTAFLNRPAVQAAIRSGDVIKLRSEISVELTRRELARIYPEEKGYSIQSEVQVYQDTGSRTLADWRRTHPNQHAQGLEEKDGRVWRKVTDFDFVVVRNSGGGRNRIVHLEQVKSGQTDAASDAAKQMRVGISAVRTSQEGGPAVRLTVNNFDVTATYDLSSVVIARAVNRGPVGKRGFDESVGLSASQMQRIASQLIAQRRP